LGFPSLPLGKRRQTRLDWHKIAAKIATFP